MWRLPGPDQFTEIVLRDSTPDCSRNAPMRSAPPHYRRCTFPTTPSRTGQASFPASGSPEILSKPHRDKESRAETLASVANLTIGWGRMLALKVSAHHTTRGGFVGDTLDTQEFVSDSTLP